MWSQWALGSITTNKASGGDGIPVELFQILKDDAVKVLHSNATKLGKLSSGYRNGKGQFSFQSQRKAMPKNGQTTAQLHSSPGTGETGGLPSMGSHRVGHDWSDLAAAAWLTNKASGGDGIPVELLQILKDDAVKVLHSICQQIWKTQQWPQN